MYNIFLNILRYFLYYNIQFYLKNIEIQEKVTYGLEDNLMKTL
jgi:hypothetical protein